MFAAYKLNNENIEESSELAKEVSSEFLQNPSFVSLENALVPSTSHLEEISSSSSSESESSDEKNKTKVIVPYKKPPPQKIEYYVDIEPRKEYLKLESMPARCLPRYRLSYRYKLYFPIYNYNSTKFKRYFKIKKKKKKAEKAEKLDKDTIEKDLKLYLTKNPNDIDKWIEYINYRENLAVEISLEPSELMSKNKFEAIEKARHFNPANQQLLELYLDTLPIVLPSEEVLNIIQDMIIKDQSNIFLWKHYLNNACYSMSCTTESGLKEHEKAIGMIKKIHDSDIQMMQLFKMCGLFVRQAGLMEQFFALSHLMTSINVNVGNNFDKIFYATSESQNPNLLEYEELVLKCNLPMPELWFRIETLRSICNFLPVQVSDNIEDPQRYVFNEDISNLVNPLKNQRAYSFDLFLIILKLFKFPLPYCKNFLDNEIFTNDDRETECGMSFLTVLLNNFYTSTEFEKIFFNVIKDINVSPNYLSFNILYEPYLECIMKFLESCSNAFQDRQNKIVLILWLRLQRLIVKVDKHKNMEPTEFTNYKKQIKSRVKNFLKVSKYQNDLSIYREYALIELSLGDEKSCFNILNMAMEAGRDDEVNFFKLLMEFCELKLMRNEKNEVIEKLTKACGSNVLLYLKEKLNDAPDDSCDELEDFFLSKSHKLELIKACVIHQLVTKSKKAALQELTKQITASKPGSHQKEQLYEFYAWISHLKINCDETLINHREYVSTISQALLEYPKNIFIMHTIASQSSLRWFDIRKFLLKTPTSESIFYLLISSKFFEKNYGSDESKIYQHRIFNTIDGLMSRKTPGISSILTWRLYLRAAFNYDFVKCKSILYQALSKYPMVKLFYLDGSRYLSEDLSQLHDLIIEKGIRIHSLIEELEILRSATK